MVVQSRILCHSNGAFMVRLVVLLCISLSVIVGQVQHVVAQRKRTPVVFGQFKQRQVVDKKGFSWEVDARGGITSNTRAFSSSHYLTINGSGMSPQMYQMTPDALQFRISGKVGTLPFVRQVKIDVERGTIRYLDSLTNASQLPVTVTIQLALRARTSSLGVKTASRYVTSSQSYNGVIPEGESGFATIIGSSSYKSAVFYLCSSKSKVRPTIINSSTSNYRFSVRYQAVIPPGKSITILHGASQQHWKAQPSDQEFAAAMRVFQSKDFTRDIPVEIRRQLINAKASSGVSEFGPLLGPLDFLAEAYEVERGEKDLLVVGDASHVAGELIGDGIPVETRLGKTIVPVEKVAAISGGAGVGRQKAVYLRTGEVLAGAVDLSEIKFRAGNGLTFELKSDQIIALFTARKESDGIAPKEVTTWMATQFGDRLALRPTSESIIEGASTWGPVSVRLEDVLGLHRNSSDDLPIHRLELTDGSQVWTILQGDALKVGTDTLGPLEIPIAAIVRLGHVQPPEEEDEEASTATSKPDATQATPSRPGPGGSGTGGSQPIPSLGFPGAAAPDLSSPLGAAPGNAPRFTRPGSATTPITPQTPTVQAQTTAGPQVRIPLSATQPPPITTAVSVPPKAVPPTHVPVQARPSTTRTPAKAGTTPPVASGSTTPVLVPLTQGTDQAAPKVGADSKPTQPNSTPASPTPVKRTLYKTWYLAGENRAVAALTAESFKVVTTAGEVTVKTADVIAMSKESEAQGRIVFAFELKGTGRLLGRFQDNLLEMSFHGQTWNVPVRHVEEFKWSAPGEEDEDAAGTPSKSTARRFSNIPPAISRPRSLPFGGAP